jgi:AcrR family transcriptional regulator
MNGRIANSTRLPLRLSRAAAHSRNFRVWLLAVACAMSMALLGAVRLQQPAVPLMALAEPPIAEWNEKNDDAPLGALESAEEPTLVSAAPAAAPGGIQAEIELHGGAHPGTAAGAPAGQGRPLPGPVMDGSPSATEEQVAELSPEQQERRRRLIDAAFELGAEGGYEAVQMRSVSETANVAMATIYRYFASKDHLLSAAMMEWTGRLRGRVAQSPPKGDTAADQMVDVLQRACKAMERQPKLSEALVRALSSPDLGVRESGAEVSRHIAEMGDEILSELDPAVRADILVVLSHVWYATLVSWANGRRTFPSVMVDLERAARVLIEPHERELRARRGNSKGSPR